MDLIKKSALDTESKFKRFFVLFLKEIKGVNYWREYVRTSRFIKFNIQYVKKHNKTNLNWWNKNYCIEILGSCNFSSYVFLHKANKVVFDQSYYLFAAFLFIFWEEEYRRYCNGINNSIYSPPIKIDFTQPLKKQYETLINHFKTKELRKMVKNWIILKQCCRQLPFL
jgi:hypothetical protein